MNIKEMAKLAGVSCATISRVLNDSGYVKEDTRKKVMEIIREYNYTPNMIARSLSSKDSFNIGIIIPNVGEKQYGKILEGAAKETAKHGYSLVFMDSENDPKTEKKWLEEVKNQHMKGLVLVPVCSENKELRGALQELEEQGTAVVLTEKDVKNTGMDGVFADEFRGAYEGICRLVEKGCKKIAIILGQPEMDAVTEERYRGCLQSLEDNGISGAEKMVFREAENLSRVFQGKKLLDAFFAFFYNMHPTYTLNIYMNFHFLHETALHMVLFSFAYTYNSAHISQNNQQSYNTSFSPLICFCYNHI